MIVPLIEDVEAVQALVKDIYPIVQGARHRVAFAAFHAYLNATAHALGMSEDELVRRVRDAYRDADTQALKGGPSS